MPPGHEPGTHADEPPMDAIALHYSGSSPRPPGSSTSPRYPAPAPGLAGSPRASRRSAPAPVAEAWKDASGEDCTLDAMELWSMRSADADDGHLTVGDNLEAQLSAALDQLGDIVDVLIKARPLRGRALEPAERGTFSAKPTLARPPCRAEWESSPSVSVSVSVSVPSPSSSTVSTLASTSVSTSPSTPSVSKVPFFACQSSQLSGPIQQAARPSRMVEKSRRARVDMREPRSEQPRASRPLGALSGLM